MAFYDIRANANKLGATLPSKDDAKCCGSFGFEAMFKSAQVSRKIDFANNLQLNDFCDKTTFADGDKFLVSEIDAGLLFDKIVYNNKSNVSGLTYHFEVVELFDVLNNASPAAALFSSPVVASGAKAFGVVPVNADDGTVIFGSPYGTYTDTATPPVTHSCAKHLGLVLVLDTIPTPNVPFVSTVKECGCNQMCKPCKADCCVLCGIDMEISVPVFMPQAFA